MRRREFIALVGAGVTWPVAALAQQAGRTYHLGCLLSNAPNEYVAFFDGLRRRGFIEGQNLTVEYRTYGQHVDLIPQYAADLVKARVDVIAASGDETVRAIQQATKTIPIVAIVGDMLGSGLVTSLARPDGNTTGVSILAGEADGKRQDILIEAVPGPRLMAVLVDVNPGRGASASKLAALQEAARAHGIEFSIHRVAKGEEIAAASAAHLPTIYEFPESAEEGGFAAYGPRRSQLYSEIMAQQIVKLFRGSKVADIPVQQPTKFELVINLKTAQAMGVTVPEALLARADKVIE